MQFFKEGRLGPSKSVAVVAGAAGDQTVRSSPGYVAGISVPTGVTVYFKDGTTQVSAAQAGPFERDFSSPIRFDTSIVLNFSAAATVYVRLI